MLSNRSASVVTSSTQIQDLLLRTLGVSMAAAIYVMGTQRNIVVDRSDLICTRIRTMLLLRARVQRWYRHLRPFLPAVLSVLSRARLH